MSWVCVVGSRAAMRRACSLQAGNISRILASYLNCTVYSDSDIFSNLVLDYAFLDVSKSYPKYLSLAVLIFFGCFFFLEPCFIL